jgi:putative chitinase
MNKYKNPIIVFQEKNNLTPDGIVGKNTLEKMKSIWKISDEQLAHFLGQCHQETGGFQVLEENLNYSAQQLADTFPKRYACFPNAKKKTPTPIAMSIQKNPEKIANLTYGERMGNRGIGSGDGYKHRGFGCVQVTGKENQRLFSVYVKDDMINDTPSLIAEKYAFESGLWYFEKNKLWTLCSKVTWQTIVMISKAVNCGSAFSKITPVHLNERIEKTQSKYKLI